MVRARGRAALADAPPWLLPGCCGAYSCRAAPAVGGLGVCFQRLGCSPVAFACRPCSCRAHPPRAAGAHCRPFLGTLYLGVLGTRATSGGSSALPALPYPTLCLRTGSACAAPSRGTSWCRSPVAGQGPGRPLCARTAPARARFACEGPPEPRSLAQAGQGPASSAEHVCRPNGIHALCFTHTSCPAVPAVRRK